MAASKEKFTEEKDQKDLIVPMQISVRAAHFFNRCYYNREIAHYNIIKHSDDLEPKVMASALKALYTLKRGSSDKTCQLNHIIDDIRSEDEREILQACLNSGFRSRAIRPSVALTVEPTFTVGTIKSRLQKVPWTPKENVVLIQRKQRPLEYKHRPLEDDNATLQEYGIKDRDSLLVCMGGTYQLGFYDTESSKYFDIPISSCFETVGDMKEKIHQRTGHPVKDLEVGSRSIRFKEDKFPLVALGLVKPYSVKMQEMHKDIEVFLQVATKAGIGNLGGLESIPS